MFKQCVNELNDHLGEQWYEQKADFEEAFDAMRLKVSKSTWHDNIYMLKHKWAECYMLNVFSIGM